MKTGSGFKLKKKKPRGFKFKLKKRLVAKDKPHAIDLTKLVFPSAHQLQMDRDIDRYRAKRDAQRKQIRIIVEDGRKGCERCLSRRAMIFSPVFNQALCLDCEEALEMGVAAETLERIEKERKTG